MQVAEAVHEITAAGAAARDLEFRHQIRSAADKAAPLIAEGFVRFTPREFIRYLRMARGEAAEVQTLLARGCQRGYFSAADLSRATKLADRTIGTITNLLKAKLKQAPDPPLAP